MRSSALKVGAVITLVFLTSWTPAAQQTTGGGVGPTLQSIDRLAFGPNGVLFAADSQAATIFAFDLGSQAGAVPGAKDLPAIDQKVAALLGTEVREIAVTDLAVHPQSRNAYISVRRGQGTGSMPVLLRVDGAGKLEVVAIDKIKYTKVDLPNPPAVNAQRNARADTVTDMAYINGRLYIAGLSNEEFASKLRSVPYPFATVDNGTSVEIYHGNHKAVETRSPVYTFVPYTVNNTPNLIAGYLCTPLVKFPLSSLAAPGTKVRGTTIAELGSGNRPLDMILYSKGGKDFLLMSNNSRGVMKIPTEGFGSAASITTPVETETGGVPYEKVTAMTGIEQLDKLDDQHSLVLARATAGTLNLQAVLLP